MKHESAMTFEDGKMTHTKGPWTFKDLAQEKRVESYYDRFEIQRETEFPNIPGRVARCGYRFNARLIAAAPELLEALMEWDEFMKNNYNPEDISWWHKTEQAIAKATT